MPHPLVLRANPEGWRSFVGRRQQDLSSKMPLKFGSEITIAANFVVTKENVFKKL